MTTTIIDTDTLTDIVCERVAQRSGSLCEICGRRDATQWYHRKPIDDGGNWSASNVLHLCTWCDHQVRRVRIGYHGLGWCVRANENPADIPVRLHHGSSSGLYLLDDQGDYSAAYPWTDLDEAV